MKPVWMTMFSLILFTTLVLRTNGSILRVCIQNCGQCKKMYGDYFLGQQCAEECMKTMGLSTPDCNKLSSVRRFLSRTRKHATSRSQLGHSALRSKTGTL